MQLAEPQKDGGKMVSGPRCSAEGWSHRGSLGMTPGRADGLWRGGDKFQNSFKIYFYYFLLMDGKKKSVWQ